jgi:hypothetical protein
MWIHAAAWTEAQNGYTQPADTRRGECLRLAALAEKQCGDASDADHARESLFLR